MGYHDTHGFAFDSTAEDNAQVYRYIRLSSHGDALPFQHLVPVAEVDGPELFVVEVGQKGCDIVEEIFTAIDYQFFVFCYIALHAPSQLQGGHKGSGFGLADPFDAA